MEIDYSVAIRTLGIAGKKYRKLLDSIEQLQPKPKEVFVVLPEGYPLPPEQLGYEKFIFAEKDMVLQRICVLPYIQTEFVLFCDDDVEFGEPFVQQLARPLEECRYDCAVAPLFSLFPPKGIKSLIAGITASACKTVFHKNQYVKILRSGGWSYNRFEGRAKKIYYPTESAPGACLFIRTQVMRQVHLEDEMWMSKFQYPSYEDRIFFYKLHMLSYPTCVVADAFYVHNDAQTSTRPSDHKPVYCGAFNQTVFWKRFIYDEEKNGLLKVWAAVVFSYWRAANLAFHFAKTVLHSGYKPVFQAFFKGLKDGNEFIKSEEYRAIPPVRRGNS